ncbi:MAG: sulfite exporter TauE/SafE family protein [Armatimonadota bacterium]
MLGLETNQWVVGFIAAMLIGVSKTSVPGIGMLAVPLLAYIFGGRMSVGVMLPMLIFADIWAVSWYRQHTQWDAIVRLLPSVLLGLIVGGAYLALVAQRSNGTHSMNVTIAVMVLAMLVLSYFKSYKPHHGVGKVVTGVLAGFTTTVSNAAGSIMAIYLTACGMSKDQFVGTSAWYFFIVNVSKVPILIGLSLANSKYPFMTGNSLMFNLYCIPAILIGVWAGRWLLPRIPQTGFNATVQILAAAGAIKLLFP